MIDFEQALEQSEQSSEEQTGGVYDDAMTFEDCSVMGARFKKDLALIDIEIYETEVFLSSARYSKETLTNYKNTMNRLITEGVWYLWIIASPDNKVLQKLKTTTAIEETSDFAAVAGYLLEGENLKLFQKSAFDTMLKSGYDFWLTEVKPGSELSLKGADLDILDSFWDDDLELKLPECLSSLIFYHHDGSFNFVIPRNSYDKYKEQIVGRRE